MEQLERRLLLYSQHVHQWITGQGYDVFEDQFGESGMVDEGVAAFVQGAFDEDALGANPFGNNTFYTHPSTNHFWAHSETSTNGQFDRQPDGGMPSPLGNYDSAPNRAIKYITGGKGYGGTTDGLSGGWDTSDQGSAAAFEENPIHAFDYLGHVAHLLQDMSVPTHAHADAHLWLNPTRLVFLPIDWEIPVNPDPYEDWTAGAEMSTNGVTFSYPLGLPVPVPNVVNTAAFNAPQTTMRVAGLPADVVSSGLRSLRAMQDALGRTNEVAGIDVEPLFEMFFETASLSSNYDSRDVAGLWDQGNRGGLYQSPDITRYDNWSQQDLQELTSILVPRAIRDTAELVRYFYGVVDEVEPAVRVVGRNSHEPDDPQVTGTTELVLRTEATDEGETLDADPQPRGDSGVGKDLFEIKYKAKPPGGTWSPDWLLPDANFPEWSPDTGLLEIEGEHFEAGDSYSEQFDAFAGGRFETVFHGEEGYTYGFQVTAEDGGGNKATDEVYVYIGEPDFEGAVFNDYELIVSARDAGFRSVGWGPSVNDAGVVAFTADREASGGYRANVYSWDPETGNATALMPAIIEQPTTGEAPYQTFGEIVQINNVNQVVARRYLTAVTTIAIPFGQPLNHPLTYLERWDAGFATLPSQAIMGDGGISVAGGMLRFLRPLTASIYPTPFNQAGGYAGIYDAFSMNNAGEVAFSALAGGEAFLGTSGIPYFRRSMEEASVQPMIADTGDLVWREGASEEGTIYLSSGNLEAVQLIAGQASGFQRVGLPGISDDGQIVTFAGDLTQDGADSLNEWYPQLSSESGAWFDLLDPGPGVFASVDTEHGRIIQRVAGLFNNQFLDPGETWEEVNNVAGCQVGDGDIIVARGAALGGFDYESRVAVNSTQDAQRAVTIVYRGYDVLGSEVGLYRSRLNFFGNVNAPGGVFDPRLPGQLTVSWPTLVVRRGQTLPGLPDVVDDIWIHDPVNSRDRGDIVFWVSTTAGDEAIVRARPREVIYLDFESAVSFSRTVDPTAWQNWRVFFGTDADWEFGNLADVLNELTDDGAGGSTRPDLTNPSALAGIQTAVTEIAQEAFDRVGANVMVIQSGTHQIPNNGQYTHVYIGDSKGSMPETYGIATSVDYFNQDSLLLNLSGGSPYKFFSQDAALLAADTLFASTSPVPLGDAPNAGATSADDVASAIAKIATHEVGHLLGLRHLFDAQGAYFMGLGWTQPDDDLRSVFPQFFSTTSQLCVEWSKKTGLVFTGSQNDQERLALSVGTDDDSVRRGPPDPTMLQQSGRINLSLASYFDDADVDVAHAVVGVVPGGDDEVLPTFLDLGSGDLATLLATSIDVGPADQLVLLASSDGDGIDIFGVPREGGPEEIDLDSGNPFALAMNSVLRGDMFNSAGSPRTTALEIYRQDSEGNTRIGSLGSSAPDANDPPLATDDEAWTDEDIAVSIDVLANDTDINGAIQPDSIVIVQEPTNGSVTLELETGRLFYQPGQAFFGDDTFTYAVLDEEGASSYPALVTVTVDEVNFAPTAIQLDSLSVPENVLGATIGAISVEDLDLNDTHAFATTDPRIEVVNGELKLVDGVGIDFEVEQTIVLEITATDSASIPLSVTETFTIVVLDAVPIAEDDLAFTTQGVAVAIPALDNDRYSDGALDPSSVTIVEQADGGIAVADPASGEITFSPDPTFWGTATVKYTVGSLDGKTSNPGEVTIDVNDAPTDVSLDNAAVSENAEGSTVGNLATTDVNVGQTHSFDVVDSRFVVVDGQLRLQAGIQLDHETDDGLALEVTVTDSGTPPLSLSKVFTISVLDVNEVPEVVEELADRLAVKNELFQVVVPADTFVDPDDGAPLAYAARLRDGSQLPLWLGFDPATRMFFGTPRETDVGRVDVVVTVTDSGVPALTAEDSFTIWVNHLPAPWMNPGDALDVDDDGFVTTNDGLELLLAMSRDGFRRLPNPPTADDSPTPYLDTNGDGFFSAADAVRVFNRLHEDASSEATRGASMAFDAEDVGVKDTGELARVSLEAFDQGGTSVDVVAPGEAFSLTGFAEDMRPSPEGMFAAYLDIDYQDAFVAPDGLVTWPDTFPFGRWPEDVPMAGAMDEVGAVAFPAVPGRAEFFTAPFAATTPGEVTFVASPADESPLHDVLLMGRDERLLASEVDYVGKTLTVQRPNIEVRTIIRDIETPLPPGPTGELSNWPEGSTWVDEWSPYWVEIWAKSDSRPISGFSFDLDYDTAYTSAAFVQYAPAFQADGAVQIVDFPGRVVGAVASSSRIDLGDQEAVLLARVRFEPTDQDVNLLRGPFDQYVTSMAFPRIDLENVEIDLAFGGERTVQIGQAPTTGFWPVMYDLNEDGRISFGDFSFFAADFLNHVDGPNGASARASDFDHSGRVDFGDLAYFASNFGKQWGSGVLPTYAADFPASWSGPALRVRGEPESNDALALTEPQLAAILDAFPGVPTDLVVEIVDLPGDLVGRALGDAVVQIDVNAAGFGWFVDETPQDHAEFVLQRATGDLTALRGTTADGRVDLRSAILHELGHVFGRDHGAGIMAEWLPLGTRRLGTSLDWMANNRHEVVSRSAESTDAVIDLLFSR